MSIGAKDTLKVSSRAIQASSRVHFSRCRRPKLTDELEAHTALERVAVHRMRRLPVWEE
jgi:hypothetical protein